MSHDYLERLYWIDDDLLQFFKDYLTPSFLENTLVITMGNKTKEKISLYLLNKILNILFLCLKVIMDNDFMLLAKLFGEHKN